jgi:hypothetical protein
MDHFAMKTFVMRTLNFYVQQKTLVELQEKPVRSAMKLNSLKSRTSLVHDFLLGERVQHHAPNF